MLLLAAYQGDVMRYHELILKEIKYKLPALVAAYAVFVVLFETGAQRVYSDIEVLFVFFAMAVSAYLFGSKEEEELIIISKASLKNVFVIRFLCTYFAFTLLPAIHVAIRSLDVSAKKAVILILTTSLFCCALGAMWRIILGNAFGALIFSSISYTVLLTPSFITDEKIRSIFDSFNPLSGIHINVNSQFYVNRYVTIGISLVILLGCYIKLSRSEKV